MANNFFYPQLPTVPVDNFCTGFIAGITQFLSFPPGQPSDYPPSYPQIQIQLFSALNYAGHSQIFRSVTEPAGTFSSPLSRP